MMIDAAEFFSGPESSGPRSFQELAELVQMLAGLDDPYGVEVRNQFGATGQVGIAEGRVVHARVGEVSGVQAFHTIMAWSGAEVVGSSRAPQPMSIEMGLPQLLLDAYWHAENLAMAGEEQTVVFDDAAATLEFSGAGGRRPLPRRSPGVSETRESPRSEPISLDRERAARSPTRANCVSSKGSSPRPSSTPSRGSAVLAERGDSSFELGVAAIANAGLMRAGMFGGAR